MGIQKITLLNLGRFDRNILDKISSAVQLEFLLKVEVIENHSDLTVYFDSGRKQYNGNSLLKMLEANFGKDESKTMALVTVDLFIPILTYIFGQAYLGGRTGITSSHRLSNERYGLEKDEKLFTLRIIKEVNHELGHCFGLIHCHQPGCVMQSSTYVEDIDQKETGFCSNCAEKLKTGINP